MKKKNANFTQYLSNICHFTYKCSLQTKTEIKCKIKLPIPSSVSGTQVTVWGQVLGMEQDNGEKGGMYQDWYEKGGDASELTNIIQVKVITRMPLGYLNNYYFHPTKSTLLVSMLWTSHMKGVDISSESFFYKLNETYQFSVKISSQLSHADGFTSQFFPLPLTIVVTMKAEDNKTQAGELLKVTPKTITTASLNETTLIFIRLFLYLLYIFFSRGFPTLNKMSSSVTT